MEDKETESNWEFPQDDVEKKIKTLETELANISKKEDKRILWGVFGLFVLIILYKLLHINPLIIAVVIPIVVFGGITIFIYENIRKKKNVLIKHGLKCNKCGHLPNFINASGLYYSQQCPKCRAKLNI